MAKRDRPKQISFKNGSAIPGPNVPGLILPRVRIFTADDVIELRRRIGRQQQTSGTDDVVESLDDAILSYIGNERRRALATPRQQAEWSQRLARQMKEILATLGVVDLPPVGVTPYDAALLLCSDEQGSLQAAALAKHFDLPHDDHLAAVRRAIEHMGWLHFAAEQAARSHTASDRGSSRAELSPRQKLILAMARLYERETASRLKRNLGLSTKGHPFAVFCRSAFQVAAERITLPTGDPCPEPTDIERVQSLAHVSAIAVRDDLLKAWPSLRSSRELPESPSG